MSIPSGHEMTMIREFVGDMLVDTAKVERDVNRVVEIDAEPAPGYRPDADWQIVGTIPCRFPVPIAGSVLGMVTRAERDLVQRRYGMLTAQDADILEGDRITEITGLNGRRYDIQPQRVDAVVFRSSHLLVISEEYS